MNLSSLLSASIADWASIVASLIVFGLYELHIHGTGKRTPMKTARSAHAAIRGEWVRAMMSRPGTEILVVQTLRNSVMAASFMATTAMLALSGTLTLSGVGSPGNAFWKLAHVEMADSLIFSTKLFLLATSFLVSFLFTAMAVRFFNHAGYLITGSSSTDAATRRQPLAVAYLNRAGHYYSLGLRAFFACIPFIAGLFSTLLLLPATLLLILVLYWFDRVPQNEQ